jgi:hypothetical protein
MPVSWAQMGERALPLKPTRRSKVHSENQVYAQQAKETELIDHATDAPPRRQPPP